MPEGNKSRVSGVGTESNRPATNFPGISVDSNQFDCLDEKSGLRCLASTTPKALSGKAGPLCQGVARWRARFVQYEEAGGSSPLTPTIF